MAIMYDEAGQAWEVDAAGNPIRRVGGAAGGGGVPQPRIPAAPKVSPAPNDYTVSKDARDSARSDRGEARDERRDARSESGQHFNETMELHGKYDQMPAVKERRIALPQFVQALKTAPNGTGDLALIYAYAKVMDPGSVVREAEMTMAGQTGSWLETRAAQLKKQFGIEGGGQLPQNVRDGLRAEMYRKVVELNQAYNVQRQRYIADAQAFGIDPVRVVGPAEGEPYMDDIQKWIDRQPGGNGGTPWQQDTTTASPAAGGFAGGGDDRKSIPIPEAMQREYADYVRANRGRLDPDAYAQFRIEQDGRFGFPSAGDSQVQVYREEAARLNEAAKAGRNLNLRIPAPDADMTVRDRVNNTVINSGPGAFLMNASPLAGGMDEVAGFVRSAALGTDYNLERDLADATRRRINEENPGSALSGQIIGPAAMGIGGAMAAMRYAPRLAAAGASLPGQLALSVGNGALDGALQNNDDRLGGAAIGAGAGAAGVGAGRYLLAPAVEAAARSRAADATVNAGVKAINALTGKNLSLRNAPRLSAEDRAVASALPELTTIRTNMADAMDRGLPYSLGDASPKLRALTGAVTRRSVDARELAENTYGPRARGQADRLRDAIDTDLAPITNLGERRDQWLRAAQDASAPLYERANAVGVEIDDNIGAMLRSPTGKDALRRAVAIAQDEGKDPFKIGFIHDQADGTYSLPGIQKQEAGRYVNAPAPNERGELSTRTFRDRNNNAFVHKGPLDLVTWVRQNGGLTSEDGELQHMGITNARRKMDFAGNDPRFGPLVNPDRGLRFDDAAELAWEAGYFPGPERPTVREFLDTLRDTYEGRNRRYLMEDMPEVERFDSARQQKGDMQQTRFETGKKPVMDMSEPAGPQPFPPLDAYNMATTQDPTFETLDLVKRGVDSRLNKEKNPLTGVIDFEGDPQLQATEGWRQRFLGAIDAKNPFYPQARGEYEKYISRREALDMGELGTQGTFPPRDLDFTIGKLDDPQLGEYRRGFATSMADTADRTRYSGDPWERVYGAPEQQKKVASLFPNAPRFNRTYELERDMARTARETTGGSATAGRLQADQQLMGSDGMLEDVGNAAVQTATGGGAPGMLSMARQFMGDRMATGFGKAGVERADRMAPTLMGTTSQQDILDYLDELARTEAEIQRRKAAARSTGGLLGGLIAPSLANGW